MVSCVRNKALGPSHDVDHTSKFLPPFRFASTFSRSCDRTVNVVSGYSKCEGAATNLELWLLMHDWLGEFGEVSRWGWHHVMSGRIWDGFGDERVGRYIIQ